MSFMSLVRTVFTRGNPTKCKRMKLMLISFNSFAAAPKKARRLELSCVVDLDKQGDLSQPRNWVEGLQYLLDDAVPQLHPKVEAGKVTDGNPKRFDIRIKHDLTESGDASRPEAWRDAFQELMEYLVPQNHPKVTVVGVS